MRSIALGSAVQASMTVINREEPKVDVSTDPVTSIDITRDRRKALLHLNQWLPEMQSKNLGKWISVNGFDLVFQCATTISAAFAYGEDALGNPCLVVPRDSPWFVDIGWHKACYESDPELGPNLLLLTYLNGIPFAISIALDNLIYNHIKSRTPDLLKIVWSDTGINEDVHTIVSIESGLVSTSARARG